MGWEEAMSVMITVKRWLWKHHLLIILDKWGVWFYLKGDDICWVWPWYRNKRDLKGNRYISICAGGYFRSLRDLDRFWVEYYEYCSHLEEKS